MNGTTPKKSVLFVIHSLGGGGAERILVNIANNLSVDRYDVTVMTIVDSGLHRKNLAPHVHYNSLIPLPGKSNDGERNGSVSGSLLAGRSHIKSIAADLYVRLWRHLPVSIVHRFGTKHHYDVEVAFLEGICTKFVSASHASRKIAWVHVDIESEQKSHAAFKSYQQENAAYLKYDKIACVSSGVCAAMRRTFPDIASRLIVIQNPIDVQEIRDKASDAFPLEYIDLIKEGRTFCSIGRLCEQKAFDRLVRAAALCKKEGVGDFSIIVMGEGPLEIALKDLSKDLGVDGLVHFIGYQKNPYPIMMKCDVFVCVSRAEGMSTTVSEALILGLPVLSTPCSGVDELFSVGEGTVIGESDEAIAEALINELDGSKREPKKDNGEVDAFFGLENAMRSIESIL